MFRSVFSKQILQTTRSLPNNQKGFYSQLCVGNVQTSILHMPKYIMNFREVQYIAFFKLGKGLFFPTQHAEETSTTQNKLWQLLNNTKEKQQQGYGRLNPSQDSALGERYKY